MSKLVIVESPTKARTIKGFLPPGYEVLDSHGHIRDLPNSASEVPARYKKEEWAKLGINVKDDFALLYVVAPENRKKVKELKEALQTADELIIATDEDREGESIGWHIFDVLKPKVPVKRIVFHEITKSAIAQALENPGALNEDLVNAQKARRILDRLVGYSLSPLLWKKVAPKLSAGRVQSAAMRMLVERERARRQFVPGAYWDLAAQLATRQAEAFGARLHALNGVRVATGRDFDKDTGEVAAGTNVIVLNEEQARAAQAQLTGMAWRVASVAERVGTRRPAAPFTTSTLQIEANRRFGFSARQTMRVAQALYESGHITYMRTDSVHLSSEAIQAARRKAEALFGADALVPQPRAYKTASRNAQEAHEAIRPAGDRMPSAREKPLKDAERRLYDLIWKRTVATQLRDARLNNITVSIDACPEGAAAPEADASGWDAAHPRVRSAAFRASGTRILEQGFLRLYAEAPAEPKEDADSQGRPDFLSAPLPPLAEGDPLDLERLDCAGHETRPPARFTDASLVKALVDNGIGRPSTYASIIDTIQQRQYAFKRKQEIVPTFMALAVVRLLEQTFSSLVDYEFTARMEDVLDQIAVGKVEWLQYVEDFFLGDAGLEVQVSEQEARIDASLFRSLELPNFEYQVRINRFGPYIERPGAGGDDDSERVDLPPDMAPADLTMAAADALFQRKMAGPKRLGLDAQGEEILLRDGRYGPYVQLGAAQEGPSQPKRVSLPKNLPLEEVTLEQAQALLDLPRTLGVHPEDGEPVITHVGRYGPYVNHGQKFVTLKDADTVFNVTLERALALLAEARPSRRAQPKVLRELGAHPEDQAPLQVLEGFYGPYVKHHRLNASLPKDVKPEALTLDAAVALLEERRQKKKKAPRRKASQRPRRRTRRA